MFRLTLILLFFTIKLTAQDNAAGRQLSLFFDQPEALRKAGIKEVKYIFKDSRKLIWIGTNNGLFRFDGTNTIYLRHRPADTSSIPGNTIVTIGEDKKGNIWIGTHGGVACINPYNLKCKVFRNELKNLAANFDNKVLVDPAGEIWTGNTDGLFLLDQKTGRFKLVWKQRTEGMLTYAYITSLAFWKKDTLVMGSFTDIVLVNTKNFGFRRIKPFNSDILVTRLHVDASHHLWIGTWGEGCIIGDSTLRKFQSYKWEKDQRSGVDNIVTAITETNSSTGNNVWVSGSNIIIKFPVDKTAASIDLSKIQSAGAENIRDNLSYMMADDENYIWTVGNSVSRFSADKNLFQPIPVNLKGLVQNIQKINTGKKNYLAISMWHGTQGLLLIEEGSGKTRSVDSVARNDQYGSNISGVAIDRFDRVWLASLGGAYLLSNQFSVISDLTHPARASDALSARKTNEIMIHHDTVWIACYKKGIDLYDLDGHKIKHYEEGDGSGLKDNLFARFFTDSHNNIWLCGNGYLYKYLPNQKKFLRYDLSIEHTIYAPVDIAELPTGDLAIATETGLIQLNPSTGKFFKIVSPLLEREESINSVCVDEKGDLWYLTTNHLVHYQPNEKKFTLFGEEDGLNINGLQCIRTFDGKQFVLANQEKLFQFTPGNWEKKIEPPQLIMHAVQVNDSTVLSSQPITQLELKHDQNKIYFEFDGISYTKPEQNLYAYQLRGVDKEWMTGNKNSVSYSNLAPGNYEFHVKAANYAGAWSKEYIVQISIIPPFWLTWWFISLSVIAISVLFYLVVRYISQRNLRERILRLEKEQAVEKERNRIARDMHDDLGSGLTKIAILSEVAKTQLQKKDEAVVQLEKISYSSRELVDNLQDIIWVLNPKNDSLENLAAYIREYALKFFDATPVGVRFNYPQQIPSYRLSEEQRRNIFLVVKETLNNIAKHACCSSVDIMLEPHKHSLLIEIKDDGKGFNMASVRHFANGLANMKARMEQINGEYSINSCAGKGTITRLKIFF